MTQADVGWLSAGKLFETKRWGLQSRSVAEDITYPVRLYGEVIHSTDDKGNWCVPPVSNDDSGGAR